MNVNDYAAVVLSRADWECVKLALSEFDGLSHIDDETCARIIDAIREQTRREVSA